MIRLKSYLCGEWRDGDGEGTPLFDPTSGEVIATASTAGLDFRAACEYARTVGGPALRAMSFAERGQMLKALSVALHEAREDFIEVSRVSGGTTRKDAKFDIDGASGTLGAYAHFAKGLGDQRVLIDGEGEQLMRSARFYGYHVKTARRGVAVHINAFNFPAWGLAEKAAAALLAGMPVISKPATSTALLAFRVMEKLVDSGVLPPGALQFVAGSPGDLLDHLDVQDVLAFTGSADTAAKLRKTKAVLELSVPLNVEADSLNATVLGPDVDSDGDLYNTFLKHVVLEMTQKAGQKCTATRRIFVPRAKIDEVEQELRDALAAVRVGDPGRDDVTMGPLATRQQLEDARNGVRTLVEAGARVVFGSVDDVELLGADGGRGFFFGPMLLRADAPSSAKAVHALEVFGPVATLMPYDSIEEAVDLVARGGGGLVCSAYSDDKDAIEALVLGLAPYHGRVLLGGSKVADQMIHPGMALPNCLHGGPGRAGGGEELGGLRGLDLYLQRTSVQGDRGVLERVFGLRA
ncbi:MAG: 3,4-dehydroadipyl-CoA semialdehyde dehydrogenase [Myxococcota bacterium]